MTDIADIFRLHGPAYRAKFGSRMLSSHLDAMRAIETCRTEALGGQAYFCTDCSTTHYSFHSCQNRHCPKCQNDKATEWLEDQTALLLPVPHFLVTFTIPEELRFLVRSHQKVLLSILFQSSAAAFQKLARDARFVGGQVGMIGVLHTWTRDLQYHPHIHYLVPAGALSEDDWRTPKSKRFLVPVKALSVIFRAKFRDAVGKAGLLPTVSREIWKKPWVVHSEPVGNGDHALAYLARYVFRVAISNKRILSLENGVVTFEYEDGETKEWKICRVAAEEFIRRFLQHVLPKGFIKVRYYGLFAPSNRKVLKKVRTLLGARDAKRATPSHEARRPANVCPKCGSVMVVTTLRRWPP